MALLSQSEIARAWGPPCRGSMVEVDLFGAGSVVVRAAITDAVRALSACLAENSYPSDRNDTGAFVCRHKVSGSGWSNHSYGTAIDLNWDENPYGRKLHTDMPVGMRRDIKAIRTKNGAQVWGWGGDWSGNKDAMHWEIVCSPRDIGSGINWTSVPDGWPGPPVGWPTVTPAPTPATPAAPAPTLMEDDDMRLVQLNESPGIALLVGGDGITKLSAESLAFWEKHLVKIPINAREYDLIVADAGHGADLAYARR